MAKATRETLQLDQYLTFLLGNEEYAIEILKVREIIEYDTVTTVPQTPRWIRGVINLRGSVVPIVDLGLKFSIGARPVTRTTCIVVVEVTWDSELITMGVMADSVNQVMDIASREILEVPVFGTRVKVDYLKGMAQLGKKFALLLDMDKILSAEEMLDLNDAVATAEEKENTVSLPVLPELMMSEGSSAAEESSRVQEE